VKFSSLSVFFPAYNDAPSLPRLLEKTFATLERCASDYEVIVVNDGSQDKTGDVLEQLAKQYAPNLRIVTHEQNRGYGGALRSGFAAARNDFVFYTDGDSQYDVTELPLLLERMGPKTGLVNGYKLERHDPAHRIWIGSLYNFCARLLFRIRIRDIDCDYRLIRRELLDKIHLTSTSGTICVELVRKLELSGWEVAEVGVHHYERLYGRSQFFRVRALASTFVQLIRLWVRLVVLRP
jgi:glycosyltransferase involved in cell wall biosynthesis